MKLISLSLFLLALPACGGPEQKTDEADAPAKIKTASDIEERLAQFVPTDLSADISLLSEEDREVLVDLLKAARIMDEIFLRQVWVGNPELRKEIALEADDPTREYFEVNFGPWDRLAELEPFVGEMPHPEGAGFYPIDMTKEEFNAWIAAYPDQRESFTSIHTVIQRQGEALIATPYSKAYGEWLDPAARHLRSAAEKTSNASLETFLNLRAVRTANLPPEAAPPRWLYALAWLGLIFLTAFSIVYLIMQLGW